jgi:Sulfatase
MVVFDELPLTSLMGPGGQIDAARYPAFARLARAATWYRGATAVHDSTALAVPAMLDGRYPHPGLRSDAYSHPANLFTLLAPSYEVNASEEATGLCPTSLCEPMSGTTLSHLSHGKVERFRRFVSSVRHRPRPALWFKHVLLPHVPWQFYPSGRSYRRHAPEPIPGLNGERGFGVPWLVKVSYQRHLLQLGLADRLLGELLGRLRRLGLYTDSLVLVVADHGIGFHVGMDRRAVTPRNVQDLAPIPLLVKLPGERRGSVVDRHVETIDVLPTILELAGVPAPAGLDGRSLLHPVAAQARRVTVFHRVGKVLNTVGGDYTFRVDDLERRWQAAVQRKLAIFGSGGGREPEALYRIGPHAELVGRRAASLPRVRGRTTALIDQAADLRRVDPASGFVPGELTGTVPNGRPGGGRPIALVVDGTIAATGRTFSLEDSPVENFEAIVPERTFHRGANEARVFEIVTRGGAPALRPL